MTSGNPLNGSPKRGKGKYYNADSAVKLEEAVASLRKELESKAKGAPVQRGSRETTFSGKVGKPGGFFHDAGLVPAGEYKGAIAMMQGHYYKVAVHKGQEVRVIGQIQKSPYDALGAGHNNQTFSIAIYDGDLAPVKRESLMVSDTPKSIQTLCAVCNAPSDGFVYIAIAATDNTDANGVDPRDLNPSDFKPKPSPYSLRIRLGDAGAESATPAEVPVASTSAGNGFGQAGELTVPSLAGADIKLGEVAFFKTKVKKGQKLRVSVAGQKPWTYTFVGPDIQATYTLTLYDDDQVQVACRKSSRSTKTRRRPRSST